MVPSALIFPRAKQAVDAPQIEQLRHENNNLGMQLRSLKDLHEKLKDDLKDIRSKKKDLMGQQVHVRFSFRERADLRVIHQEQRAAELTQMRDTVKRIQSRIIQSPERIKRSITLMNTTTVQEKKMIYIQENKSKDLLTKISTLKVIEKVSQAICS